MSDLVVGAAYAVWDRSSPFVSTWWRNAPGDVAMVFRASGGHHAAALLTEIVIEAMTEPATDSLVDRARWPIERAHEAALAVLGPAFVAIASAVCAATRGDRIVVAHVGNARAFRIRSGECTALTADHVIGGEGPLAGLVTRSIGTRDGFAIDAVEREHEPGDVLLLCSRDVVDAYAPEDFTTLVAEHGREAPRVIVDASRAREPSGTAAVVLIK